MMIFTKLKKKLKNDNNKFSSKHEFSFVTSYKIN